MMSNTSQGWTIPGFAFLLLCTRLQRIAGSAPAVHHWPKLRQEKRPNGLSMLGQKDQCLEKLNSWQVVDD